MYKLDFHITVIIAAVQLLSTFTESRELTCSRVLSLFNIACKYLSGSGLGSHILNNRWVPFSPFNLTFLGSVLSWIDESSSVLGSTCQHIVGFWHTFLDL